MAECQDTMSIHTRKITDSCRDKDCIEDLRVYLTTSSQTQLEATPNARVRCAELLFADIEVEPVAFDRNHYCIDVTFYYRVLADATVGIARPVSMSGLAVFSKRAVLCGEDSSAHIFTSQTRLLATDDTTIRTTNRPTAVIEVLDPMVLSSKVNDITEGTGTQTTPIQIPESILSQFDEALVTDNTTRQLFVTLGQFSIIRLEREAQLVVNVVDYSLPSKECCDSPGCAEDPCEMFSRIPFPARQFSPRNCDEGCAYPNDTPILGCGCTQSTQVE